MAIHGKSLAATKEDAKAVIMQRFVTVGEMDGVPPTLRAMYAIKVQQASAYIDAMEAGNTTYQSLNRCIEKDAEDRGYPAIIMAHAILQMAADSLDLEDQRLKVNVRIEAAKDEKEIVAILREFDLDLNVKLV